MKRAFILSALFALCACSIPIDDAHEPAGFELSASGIAGMFASLPMEPSHLREVYDAVALSSGNGYDEEYTLDSLLLRPGAGMGPGTRAAVSGRPLRELIIDYLESRPLTRSGVDDIMERLLSSGYQLYWPYSEDWDGETYPVITFDPGYGAESNYGYELAPGPEGAIIVDTLEVNEAMAMTRPVWVVNSNDDSAFTPLELFRTKGGGAYHLRQSPTAASPDPSAISPSSSAASPDPSAISPGPSAASPGPSAASPGPSAISTGTEWSGEIPSPTARQRKLMLKSFNMIRNYDSWFGGASEFFVRIGCADGFNAATDAELKLYTPSVTDFMIVVKRRYVGKDLPFEAILVTDFTSQIDKLAFLIVEDDGGTRTNWKCQATVKFQSKTYGFDIDIPYNEKDDIVWRGQISRYFFEEEDTVTGRFGDVVCSFELE